MTSQDSLFSYIFLILFFFVSKYFVLKVNHGEGRGHRSGKTKEKKKIKISVYVVAMPYGITDMYSGASGHSTGKIDGSKRNKTRNFKIE